MVKRLWLFGLILGVPLIGFAVAEGIQAHFNSEFRSVLREQFTDAFPDFVSSATIDDLCEKYRAELRDICSTNSNLNLMSSAAVGAGGVGLFLLIGIWLAGLLARSNRRLLLYLFRPGLYLTAILLIGLVLVHAVVAMAAMYYGTSALIGRVHYLAIGAIGLGALYGVLAIARNAFSLVCEAQTMVIGKTVSRREAPALWKRVGDLAHRLGALQPAKIILGLDPNFFVTEVPVMCRSTHISGRTLYCSLPLMRILSRSELDAVLGHELGHYKGLDTKFSQEFFPIYRGTANSIDALQETGGEGSGSIALLPAIAILSYFLECFSVAESRIGRSRELVADQEGIAASDGASMASALVKLHAFSGLWDALETAMAKALIEGEVLINASKTFADVIASKANPEALQDIGDAHLTHPTDSHPPLSLRLEALGVTIEEVSRAALNVQPESAAIQLLPEPESCEQAISVEYQALLAQHLGVAFDAPKKRSFDVKELEVPVPGPSSQLTVQCWGCKNQIEVTAEIRGKKIKCPYCSTKQEMPR